MAIYAAVATIRNISNTLDQSIGYDLFSYYWPLQYVRQGLSPYTKASQEQSAQLVFPISHLNGTTSSTSVVTKFGDPVPANTPIMLILLYPLSLFTWDVAKILWFCANIIFLITSILVILNLVDNKRAYFTSTVHLIFFLLVLGMLAVRNSIGNGQTTLFIMVSLLLSFFFYKRQRPTLAGLALGIGLSKYTLGISLFVYFIYKRQWWSLLIAVVVQCFGFIILSVAVNTSLPTTIISYLQMVSFHTNSGGVHIGNYLPMSWVLSSIIVTSGFALVAWLLLRKPLVAPQFAEKRDLIVFCLCINWSLLTIYHAYYDVSLVILNTFVLISIIQNPLEWRISERLRRPLIIYFVVMSVLLAAPGTFVERFLPSAVATLYIQLIQPSGTLIIFINTVLCFLILRNFLSSSATAPSDGSEASASQLLM